MIKIAFCTRFLFCFRRYIKDSERKDLLEHATTYCVQSFKDLLKKHAVEQRNDNEMLTLIIEIFKAHKKLKNVSQKESPFSGVLVDTYKAYAEGKVWLQENVNYLDSANKFCTSLTNGLKAQEKQQQLTGISQTLEELGMKNLASSLSKASTVMPTAMMPTNMSPMLQPMGQPMMQPMVQPIIQPIGQPLVQTMTQPLPTPLMHQPSPITQIKPVILPTQSTPPTVPLVTISTVPTTTTTATPTPSIITPISTMNTGTVGSVTVPSRPRGRPPGSKNQTSKADKQKMMASSLAGPLSNLESVTAHLEPSVRATVLALLTEPNFMIALTKFPDTNSRNHFLSEYFAISKFPNIQQLVDGFNGILSYLASTLPVQSQFQGQPPSVNLMHSPPKPQPKVEKPAPVPTVNTSSMSIFPTTNKPHLSLQTSPSKPVVTPSIPASIIPMPASTSLLKSNVSTVLSVGSGQLTITPSISITPNPTKSTSSLPQMPAPTFNIQKTTAQPKVRRSAGDKPTKPKTQKAQRLSQGLHPDLPTLTVEHLPKSLSIIPSSFMASVQQPIASTSNVNTVGNKPPKQTKSKRKSIDGSVSIAPPSKLPKLDAFNKSIVNQQMQAHLSPLINPAAMNQISFLSNYEQFLSNAPQTSISIPKQVKGKTSTVTSSTPKPQQPQKQQGSIKVKQLEQLQGRKTPKLEDKQSQQSGKQSFSTTPTGNTKNAQISRNPTVLNAYGTTISSVPNTSQVIPSTFTSLPIATSNLPANLQIRFVSIFLLLLS